MAGDPFYKQREWYKLRSKVKKRWLMMGYACPYCGQPMVKTERLIVDHIKNRKKHPQMALVESNLQLVHHACNTRKYHHVENNDKPQIGLDGLPDDWR